MALDLGELVGYLKLDDSQFTGPLEQLPDEVKRTGSKAANEGKGVGSKMGDAIGRGLKGAATGAVTIAATGIGVALVKGFSRLEGIDNAQKKLTGLGHDAQSVEKIMGNALASVKGTAYGIGDAATVAASAVAAGVKPGEDLERTLSLVADAATIAGTDMGSMGAIFNKAAASNKVQMDVINQLHDAGVPALAALADHMGVTAEEASKMASAGKIDFNTFQAAMEGALGGAAQSSGETFSGAMANVGASLGRIGAGLMGSVFPVLAPLLQAIGNALGPVEDKAAALGEAIGQKLVPWMEKLMGWLEKGPPDLSKLTNVLGPATGAFIALGASGLAPLLKMVPGLGGLAGKLSFLGGPMGLVLGAIVGLVAASPELRDALGQLLTVFGDLAGKLASSLEPLITALLPVLVGVLDGVANALVWVVDVLAGFIGWLASSEPAVALITGAVIGLTSAFVIYKAVTGAITTATKVAAAAQKLWNAAMMLNPIGIVIGLVAALVGALVWFFTQTDVGREAWEAFVTWLGEAWQNIVDFAVGLWTGLGEFFSGLWSNITEGVTIAWEAVGSFFSDLWANIGSIFEGAVQFLVDLFMNWTVYGLIIQNWDSIVAFFGEVWENIKGFFAAAFDWLVDLFLNWTLAGLLIQYWDDIVATAKGAWDGLIAWFKGIPGWIRDIFVAAGTWLLGAGNNIITGLRTGVSNMWNGFISWLRGFPGQIIGFFAGAGSWLWNAGKNIVQGLMDGVASLAGSIGDFFLNLLPGWIVEPFKSALGIHSPSRLFAEYGGNLVQGVMLGVDDEQPALDARMRHLVETPAPVSISAAVGGVAGATADAAASGAERWAELSSKFDELAEAVREARPIEVHSNDPEEVATVVGEHLR